MTAYEIVFEQGGEKQKVAAKPNCRIVFGSSKETDCQLQDETVSSNHFRIRVNERGCLLRDLNSRNGTFVDGRRVDRAQLDDGTEIRAGKTMLYVYRQQNVPDPKPNIDERGRKFVACLEAAAGFQADARQLATRLATAHPAFLLLAAGTLDRRTIVELKCSGSHPMAVFDWLPDEQHQLSPWLLPLPRDTPGLAQKFEQLWNPDLCSVVFSECQPDHVVHKLSQIARGQESANRPVDPDRLQLDFSPGHLCDWLPTISLDWQRSLLSVIDALMFEIDGRPVLRCRVRFSETLHQEVGQDDFISQR